MAFPKKEGRIYSCPLLKTAIKKLEFQRRLSSLLAILHHHLITRRLSFPSTFIWPFWILRYAGTILISSASAINRSIDLTCSLAVLSIFLFLSGVIHALWLVLTNQKA